MQFTSIGRHTYPYSILHSTLCLSTADLLATACMAKKKTKTKASLLVAEAVAAVNATKELSFQRDGVIEPHHSRNESSSSKRMRTVDILTAHLKPNVGKSSSMHMKPRVILTADDALRLNLHVEDDVIIISLHDFSNEDSSTSSSNNIDTRGKIKALLVMPVEIFDENPYVSNSSSPALRPKDVSHTLPPGTIQFTSSSVLGMLESTSTSKHESFISQNVKCEVPVAPFIQSPTSPISTPFSDRKSVV